MPEIVYQHPCWQLAYTYTQGYDPTPNVANRWWYVPCPLVLPQYLNICRYWRQMRSAFGRFERDSEGLFFMRGVPPPAQRKRARVENNLGETEELE